ncbi:hypothetical protein [Methanothermococcus sp.]|uniref:hypothetical protein n=1 Tax=Methanothermococcus sp. TaxID=2614238 RepID=UPI0025CCC248|nr:hypothetical protein [Methanothermococcus sp.]
MCAPIAITAGAGAPTIGMVLPQIMGMIVLGLAGIWAIVSTRTPTKSDVAEVETN